MTVHCFTFFGVVRAMQEEFSVAIEIWFPVTAAHPLAEEYLTEIVPSGAKNTPLCPYQADPLAGVEASSDRINAMSPMRFIIVSFCVISMMDAMTTHFVVFKRISQVPDRTSSQRRSRDECFHVLRSSSHNISHSS